MKEQNVFKLAILFCLGVIGVQAQTQTKEWKESFNVNNDVTVHVETVNTDLVFETWNQNKVEVVATMEIEGLSKEEAQEYFNQWDFEAMGNSSKVEITSGGSVFTYRNPNVGYAYTIDVQVPEIPSVNVAIPPVPPVPSTVLNQLGNVEFDYEAFQKDGEKYMKEFKKKWEKNFDSGKIQAELEKWKEELEKSRKEFEKIREEMLKNALEAENEARMSAYEATRAKLMSAQNARQSSSYTAFSTATNEKGVSEITIQKGGKTIHLKIKKSIQIKMPKNSGLQLNVRHGEVKLASQTNNINANLSYASLLANEVDGDTWIRTSYAPVKVTQWNQGKLIVNFSGEVDLETVKQIDLEANSSDILIHKILESAAINARFGELHISGIDKGFATLNLRLNNMDSYIATPDTAYRIRLNLNNISLNLPKDWTITKGGDVIEGYRLQADATKSMSVSGMYNNVQFL